MNQCVLRARQESGNYKREGGNMRGVGSPLRVLWLVASVMALAVASHAGPPTMTTVSDVVYRADGSTASGTILISWPEFTTVDAKPVAAGTLSVAIGAGGAVSIALAPNAGGNPDGTYYKVVLKLDDGTTETESWVIPASATPVTIGSVRSTVVPASVALQVASRQYVDNAVASRATDTGVVHLAGQETIAGTKLFATPPSVPTPVQAVDVANKSYVDLAVAAVGAGSFVSKAGDAMNGPLTLPSENGARVCFYYPRLAPQKKVTPTSGVQTEKLRGLTGLAASSQTGKTGSGSASGMPGTVEVVALHASFLALPTTDVNDGEQILCYRSFFPASSAALY